MNMYGFPTESWNLGPNKSFLHLDTKGKPFTVQNKEELEARCNDAIRSKASMTPRWIEEGSPELESIRCRGLPEGTKWPVRVVEIDEVDANLCCGTHVKRLSDLQAIKITHSEKVKGQVRLWFYAGERVLQFAQLSHGLQTDLTKFLMCAPEAHPDRVEKMVKAQKESQREKKKLMEELASLHALALKAEVLAMDEGRQRWSTRIIHKIERSRSMA